VISKIRKIDEDLLVRLLSLELAKKHHLVRARGVEQRGDRRISRYQFNHNLFQKYLYSTLDPVERVQQHQAIGTALESLYQNQTEEIALQLARHFLGSQLGFKASRYLLLAGQNAARILAFNEATMHFEQGLSELKNLDSTPEINRLEYDLQLGLAQALWHSGRVIEAVSAFKEVIEIARALGDPHALANVVLAYEEPRWRLNLDTQLTQHIIREALSALDDEQSGLRVRLLVSLSRSLVGSGDQEELRATVDQALITARQTGDPLTLIEVLRIKTQIDRRPETTSERLVAIQEMIATAESIGDKEMLVDGLGLYVYDLLELGQIDQVDKMIEAQRRVAQEIKHPFQMHIAAVFQTMRAILQGDFEVAERFAKGAADLSQQIGVSEIDGIYGIHMFTIRREQGRINEIAPIIKLIVDNNPESSVWRPGMALIFSILNQRKECEAIFEYLASDGFAFFPHDSLRVGTLSYLSEVCAFLGEVDQAAALYHLLLPYDGRTVVVGGATACFGAAARFLGMLATTMEDWESAEQHFQAALEQNERIGAWPWLAHTQYEYASMLITRGQAQGREWAKSLLNQSLNSARRMGMLYLAQKVVDLQAHSEITPS
jgi:tetratricopeptide (TPR) repeat protein